jgi:hypothetical protein
MIGERRIFFRIKRLESSEEPLQNLQDAVGNGPRNSQVHQLHVMTEALDDDEVAQHLARITILR